MSNKLLYLVIGLLSLLIIINISQFSYLYLNDEYQYKSKQDKIRTLYLKGKYQRVLEYSDEVEKEYPSDISLFYYRGLSLYNLKKYPEAIDQFQKGYHIRPTSNEMLSWIRLCEKEKKRFQSKDDLNKKIEGYMNEGNTLKQTKYRDPIGIQKELNQVKEELIKEIEKEYNLKNLKLDLTPKYGYVLLADTNHLKPDEEKSIKQKISFVSGLPKEKIYISTYAHRQMPNQPTGLPE